MIRAAHFILYVSDQAASTEFYTKVLGIEPRLNVQGMTEFEIGRTAVLGLMPYVGAARLLGEAVYEGSKPKAELYLIVESPSDYHTRALSAGAREISPLSPRDWGHNAAYCIDIDGYIIAFAEVSG
jgi:catechol 2,3-dioxygenase-like lactoylglutathione lyase family enzyme